MTRRKSTELRLAELLPKVEAAFTYEGNVYPSPVVCGTVDDAWAAWHEGSYDRAEQLALVAEFLIKREGDKFAADPARWRARQLELAT